jgi:PTH1 family peptidyl-tRNA hydrolase
MSRLTHLFERFRPPAKHEQPGAEGSIQWIVMGLGNPGAEYRRSRHNLGFMTIQLLAKRYSSELARRKFNGSYGEIRIAAGNAIIVTPETFYNRSGECAAAMLGYYKVRPEHLIVVHDEMDLPEHQLRLKRGGGDAGNRGVRSISQALGTPDFIRVRIGIAHPAAGEDSIDYLLQPLSEEELRSFQPVLERAADAVVAIMSDGVERASSTFNQRVEGMTRTS